MTPTSTARAAASAAYLAGSAAASGPTAVAVSRAVVDSGPTESRRRRAEDGVREQGGDGRPQPGQRRQARDPGVRHALRHQVGGDGDAGEQVTAQPGPLVVAEHHRADRCGRPAA